MAADWQDRISVEDIRACVAHAKDVEQLR